MIRQKGQQQEGGEQQVEAAGDEGRPFHQRRVHGVQQGRDNGASHRLSHAGPVQPEGQQGEQGSVQDASELLTGSGALFTLFAGGGFPLEPLE